MAAATGAGGFETAAGAGGFGSTAGTVGIETTGGAGDDDFGGALCGERDLRPRRVGSAELRRLPARSCGSADLRAL